MSSLLSFEGEMSRGIAASERKMQKIGWYEKLFQERWESEMKGMEGKVLILGASAAKRLT
jgi:hypothetical protein